MYELYQNIIVYPFSSEIEIKFRGYMRLASRQTVRAMATSFINHFVVIFVHEIDWNF